MLNGSTNEERIWNYLKGAGLNDCGAAGLMGNLYAESGLRPNNLQNTYEKSLGYTDETYTAAVDSGAYAELRKGRRRGMDWPSGHSGRGSKTCWPMQRQRGKAWETWKRSLDS